MAHSEVTVSHDGRRRYLIDTIAQVDTALAEVSRTLKTAEQGTTRMGLRWDADMLLDRRIELARIARRDGVGFTVNHSGGGQL